MEKATFAPAALPAGLDATRGAVQALGALFSLIEPEAWDSLARPSAHQVAQLFWLVGSRLDEVCDGMAMPAAH